MEFLFSVVTFPFRLIGRVFDLVGRTLLVVLGFLMMVLGGALAVTPWFLCRVIGIPLFVVGLLVVLRALA